MQAPALRVIDLCGNQMKRVGAVAAAKASAGLAGLELLSLDENTVSEAGLDEVSCGRWLNNFKRSSLYPW
jgi:hypothetical protein